jgi:hypothetical protein
MSDVKITVVTPQGRIVGFFINPKIENLCQNDFEISGTFVDEEGHPFEKVDCNPEVIPYAADLSPLSRDDLKTLARLYVQRGRQPVVMTGVRA